MLHLQLQNWRCYICGERLSKNNITRDHVFPHYKNRGRVKNVLLAHEECNVQKAGREPKACEVFFLEDCYNRKKEIFEIKAMTIKTLHKLSPGSYWGGF